VPSRNAADYSSIARFMLAKSLAELSLAVRGQLVSGDVHLWNFAGHPIVMQYFQQLAEIVMRMGFYMIGTGSQHIGLLDVVEVARGS